MLPGFYISEENRYLKPLLLAVALLTLILLILYIYYIRFRPPPQVQRERPTEVTLSNLSEPEIQKQQALLNAQENLEQKIKDEQAAAAEEARILVGGDCSIVPPTDPTVGITHMLPAGEGKTDYYYEARLTGVEETEQKGCDYWTLHYLLDYAGQSPEFKINIPKGLLGNTDFGEMSASIFKDHTGELMKIMVRYETSAERPNDYKMVGWEPLIFYLE